MNEYEKVVRWALFAPNNKLYAKGGYVTNASEAKLFTSEQDAHDYIRRYLRKPFIVRKVLVEYTF